MRRSILAAAIAAVLSAAGPAAAQTKMIIGTGIDPSTSLFYVAEGAGFFKKNGLDVQLNLGSSGSAMFPLVVGNQLQAALGSDLAAIQVHNLNGSVVITSEGARMRRSRGGRRIAMRSASATSRKNSAGLKSVS